MRNKMIKAIWSISKNLDIDKDNLYQIVWRETKKEGISECSNEELKRILKVLEFFNKQEKVKSGMITEKQLNYIRVLEEKLNWKENPNRLLGFIKKYSNVDELNWLKQKQASNIIEGLKKILVKQQEGANG